MIPNFPAPGAPVETRSSLGYNYLGKNMDLPNRFQTYSRNIFQIRPAMVLSRESCSSPHSFFLRTPKVPLI